MRAYAPISWAQLSQLVQAGSLPGPLRACAVDPAWRAGAAQVEEEEWEYEAQLLAAQVLGQRPGVLLAIDPEDPGDIDDGWVRLVQGVRRRDVAALLTEDLGWFGVQEAAGLLDEQS